MQLSSRMNEALIAKITHDLASPAGATFNGLELMKDDLDTDFMADVVNLADHSAKQLMAMIRLFRCSYGHENGCTGLKWPELADVARNGLLDDKKHTITFEGTQTQLAAEEKRLVLNLLACAVRSIPRGGVIAVTPEMVFTITTKDGESAPDIEAFPPVIDIWEEPENVSPCTLQKWYTTWYASSIGKKIHATADGATVTVSVL